MATIFFHISDISRISVLHLFELRIRPAADPLGDVVDVGAGGAGEAEAVGALLDLQDVGARRAEHQHDGAHMWPRRPLFKFSCALRTCGVRRTCLWEMQRQT